MASLRDNGKTQNAQWPDYVGSILRGTQPINQLVPQHPYLKDVPGLEEFQSKKTVDIILLTIPEAMRLVYDKRVNTVSSAYSCYESHSMKQMAVGILDINKSFSDKGINVITLYDTWKWAKTSWEIMSYYDQANNLAWNISQVWKVKAITYIANGKTYIKITGYAGLHRILNGVLYLFDHPQMIRFGIGKMGIVKGIASGTRYNIILSGYTHILEFIFKSEYDIVDLFVDITMDIAKIMVAEIVFRVIAGIIVSAGAPVILTALAIIVIGVMIAWSLNELDSDDNLNLSNILKNAIRRGSIAHAEILMHDSKNLSPWKFALSHMRSYP
ncbi:TPA: hypothetical protein JDL67_004496 [Salmonella enterica subsp. salamae]|nr:hypothetical protein [Salmonella enterica subsp. salamae]